MDEGGVRVLYHIYTRVTQQQIFIVEPVERGRPWDVDDDDDDCLNKIPIGFAKIPRINLTSSCSPFQEFNEPVSEPLRTFLCGQHLI